MVTASIFLYLQVHCFSFYLLGVGWWGWQTRVFSLWRDISASSEQGKYLLPVSASDQALCKVGYWPSVMWFVSGDGATLVFICLKKVSTVDIRKDAVRHDSGCLSQRELVWECLGWPCLQMCLQSRFPSWHPLSQWPEDLSEILIANDFTLVHVTRDAILMMMFVYRTWERDMGS